MNFDIPLRIDMDGVQVNLFGHISNVLGKDYFSLSDDEKHRVWKEQFHPDWFLYASPFDDTKMLMEFCTKNFYNLASLTGLPRSHPHYAVESMHNKLVWSNAYNGHHHPVTFGPFAHDKHKHCGGPNFILIDDLEDNIIEWRNAGGFAIHHINAVDTLERLEEFLKQYRS